MDNEPRGDFESGLIILDAGILSHHKSPIPFLAVKAIIISCVLCDSKVTFKDEEVVK